MTLRPVNNPVAGVAQRTRMGRHLSGMTRRDLGDQEKNYPNCNLANKTRKALACKFELARAENPPGSVSRGGRFINEDADRKRL